MQPQMKTTTITTQLLKLVGDESLPIAHRFAIATRLLWAARTRYIAELLSDYAFGSVQNAGLKTLKEGLVGQVRESKDMEWVYFLRPKGASLIEYYTGEDNPPFTKKRSKHNLEHEDKCVEICLALIKAHLEGRIELLVLERAPGKLTDATFVHKKDGTELRREIITDIYFLFRLPNGQLRSFFWEVAEAVPGKDKEAGRPSIDTKIEAHFHYSDDKGFQKLIREEFGMEVEINRMIFTFPTVARAINCNLNKIQNPRIVPRKRSRFMTSAVPLYEPDLFAPVFQCGNPECPCWAEKLEDRVLHSLLD